MFIGHNNTKYASISNLTRPDPARPNAFQTSISPKLFELGG